jgi:hypothetical protein
MDRLRESDGSDQARSPIRRMCPADLPHTVVFLVRDATADHHSGGGVT